MVKLLRNFMVLSVTTSLFMIGCGGKSHNKVRLPMRQSGPDLSKAGEGTKTGDGSGIPQVPDGAPAIDMNDKDIKDMADRQKAYDEARNALENDGSEIQAKDLAAGIYKISGLATELVMKDNTVGILSIHNVDTASNKIDLKASSTIYKGTIEEGMVDSESTNLNIASQFDLIVSDKIETSNVAQINLNTRVDMSKPQSIQSLNAIKTEAADALKNIDYLTSDEATIKKSLGKDSSMVLTRVSASEIRMRISIELGDGKIRNIFITYKMEVGNDNGSKTETGDTTATTTI